VSASPGARAPDILVGNDYADDAAVVRFASGAAADERALVLTADVIAPLVDDAETFGAIAATNAASDVYAMGGRPLFALNLAFFPDDQLPLEVLRAILRGGARACERMGIAVVGGHTVRDGDIKFGLSVTGEVSAQRIWSNRGGRPGQALVLTKALGTGIIGTSIKQDAADPAEAAAAIASMTTPNGPAAEIAQRHRVTACTDVTGFGLLGHLRNIVRGSGVDAVIELGALPLLPGALAHARAGHVPGGSKANLAFLEPMLVRAAENDPLLVTLAADAQTSGGLLLCVEPADADALVAELRGLGLPATRVGALRERPAGAEPRIELR
jgi:selenide,water dikinase